MGRDFLARVLRGEPHHGQVRSLQRRSSPWPGRCKLGFSHFLQCLKCPRWGMHRVRWVALWYEFGWLLMRVFSRIVHLPSVLHIGVSLLFLFSPFRVWAVIDFWSSDACALAQEFHTQFQLGRNVVTLRWLLLFQAQATGGLLPGQARSLPDQ